LAFMVFVRCRFVGHQLCVFTGVLASKIHTILSPEPIRRWCLRFCHAVNFTGRRRLRWGSLSHEDTMSRASKRWLGVALIFTAVTMVFASTKFVDVPGPMEASKPEFNLEFSAPFSILSIVLAFVGARFFVSSLRSHK